MAGAEVRAGRPVRKWSQLRFGTLVLIPVMAWFIIFMLIPIGQTFWLSFRRFNPLNLSVSSNAGFANFVDVFADPRFQTAVTNSLVYAVAKVAIIVPLATVLAIMLASSRRRHAYVFMFFLPSVMSMLPTGMVFRYLYNPSFGLFNEMLTSVGMPPSDFISSPDTALASLIAMDVWKGFGFYTLILMAGVLQIPHTVNEAARIDGAGPVRTVFSITLPLAKRVLGLVVIMATISSLQVFDSAYALSISTFGPQDSMLTISGLIYVKGILTLDLGYGAAASLVLFVAIMIVTLVQLRLTRSNVEY